MDIKTKEFIPPQFYKQYTVLSKYAAELRASNHEVKTQIQFEELDIEIYMKNRGTDHPFQPAGIEELARRQNLPEIESNIQWKRKEDKPAWRNVSPQHKRVVMESLGGQNRAQRQMSPDREPANKKSKHQLSADSSISGDSSSSSPAKLNTVTD